MSCYLMWNSTGICNGSTIVINDLKSATSKFDPVMYADDTTLVSTLENFGDRNNAKEIEQNINKEIYKITTWLHSTN